MAIAIGKNSEATAGGQGARALAIGQGAAATTGVGSNNRAIAVGDAAEGVAAWSDHSTVIVRGKNSRRTAFGVDCIVRVRGDGHTASVGFDDNGDLAIDCDGHAVAAQNQTLTCP